jgi:hypothetical protein
MYKRLPTAAGVQVLGSPNAGSAISAKVPPALKMRVFPSAVTQ